MFLGVKGGIKGKMAEGKVKYAMRVDLELQQEVKDWFPEDKCHSQNKFKGYHQKY